MFFGGRFMIQKAVGLLLVFLMLFSLASCTVQRPKAPAASETAASETPAPTIKPTPVPSESPAPMPSAEETAAAEDSDAELLEKISQMTLEEKLAQMMIPAFYSRGEEDPGKLTEEDRTFLSHFPFGGVILFGGSIRTPEQTMTLISEMQDLAAGTPAGIPLFVCTDQEGGEVSRLSFGTTGPGNMALAAAGDPSLTRQCAEIFGEELSVLGFNVDFAPVADINVNPENPVIGTRAFSDDPARVSLQVGAFVEGLHEKGVLAVLKHFPGHGNVDVDSHSGLPRSDLTREELSYLELLPFAEGIRKGAEMIMTAHIQFPQIETKTAVSKEDGSEIFLPATLSRTILTDLLRNEMGFEGLIVTDAMDMEAIASHFDPASAAALAIGAGADLLLCPLKLPRASGEGIREAETFFQSLCKKVESGAVPMEEIDDSVFRILKLKKEKGLLTVPPEKSEEEREKALEIIGSEEHLRFQWEAAQKGITLLKNTDGLLPLSGISGEQILILVSNGNRRASVSAALSRLEEENLLDPSLVTVLNCDGLSYEDPALQQALGECSTVLILSQYEQNTALLSDVLARVSESENQKAALISLGLPYDCAQFSSCDALLCAYNPYGTAWDEKGNGPLNLNVACALCMAFGEGTPQGTLPVELLKIENGAFASEILYGRGSGLKNWGESPES